MSWGTRRRNTIILIFIILLISILALVVFAFLNKPANCFDKKQNGDEIGIDCGGSCQLLCQDQTINPIVLWTRYFEVGPGRYNVVTLLENQNPNASVSDFEYSFSIFNRENVLIAERSGKTKLEPKSIVPIFEAGLITNNQSASRVEFDYSKPINWQKKSVTKSAISVLSKTDVSTLNNPSVRAEILNTTSERITNITMIAIVYDSTGNALGSLSTFVEVLNPEEKKVVNFNWFNNFPSTISKIDVFPIHE